MEKWKQEGKGKPEGWTVKNVPLALVSEWLESPGVEDHVRDSMEKAGIPRDAQVISVAESMHDDHVNLFLHPVAAYNFGMWYAEKLDAKNPRPRYGVLYAAIYDNGLTKIGMATSGSGEDRLAQHDSMMDLTGAKPVEHIVMECKARAYGAETKLVSEMAARYEQKRREWFFDVEPDVVRKLMADCIEKDWQERCQSAKVSA